MRQNVLALWVCTCLFAAPRVATPQQVTFVQAVLDLTTAMEGALGDEGAQIVAALDAMSRALAQWDVEIAALEAEVRSTPGFEKRLALGRMYAARGRLDDAGRELEVAGRMQPQRADVHVLRGLVLDAAGKSAEAAAAFQSAWVLDRTDAVTAYYVFRHAAGRNDVPQAQDALQALAAAHSRILKETPRAAPTATPFARIALLEGIETPLLPLAAYSTGYVRITRGDFEGAIAEWRRAAASDPLADPAVQSAALRQAVAAFSRGRLAEARTLLEQSNTDSSEAHRVLGLIYWAESEYGKSVDHLDAAIRLNPRDERARLALSRVLGTAGRDADAELALLETIRLFPESPRAHLWLASSYERFNRFVDARHEYERAVGGTAAGRSSIYGSIGRMASGAADVGDANEAFARAVAANPNDAAMRDVFAGSLLQDDRTDEAFAEFVAALLVDPRDDSAHAGIGQIHLNAGRHAEAVAALRRAVDLAPDNVQAQYALATALTRLGRHEDAREIFVRVEQAQRTILADRRRALSLDVLREEAALRAGERNYDRAAALWQQVIEREPARASNRVGLAAVLESAGRIALAIEQYERAVTLGAPPAVYLQLAHLYEKAGRDPDAARARLMYEKVLQGDRANDGPAR
jgi:tetratricopeptide (TPR) repeat protein